MDTLTILAVTAAAIVVVVLAWLGGYELGQQHGISAERELANRRVNGVLAELNKRKPKAAKNRRKASRKAVAA